LDVQEVQNEFAWPIDTFKHRFIEPTQVVFCGGQKAEYRFSGLFNQLNHRFIDLTKFAFCGIQKAEN
jgi:hypothetical protein